MVLVVLVVFAVFVVLVNFGRAPLGHAYQFPLISIRFASFWWVWWFWLFLLRGFGGLW